MASFGERVKHGWNAFLGRDPTIIAGMGIGTTFRPDKAVPMRDSTRTILNTIFNRIAVDAASVEIKEVIVDEAGKFKESVKSGLNTCLSLSANIDQTGRALRQDIYMSLFDEGVIAVVPTDTNINPETGAYDIEELRVGKVTEWFPEKVRVDLYNEITGRREEIVLPKKMVAVIENPFYSLMNEPNSVLRRLISVLNKLDITNEDKVSNKFNMIIQLPFAVKSALRKEQADQRVKDIETQLMGNKYGIAYIDGTEKVTQLNRPLESDLWEQAKEYTTQLYSQLGLTPEIFNGTADEAAMLNYNNRTIEPLVAAIANEFERKFLTKTARGRGHAVKYFSDPFKLVPVNNLAEIADKFTRNEIMSSNEFRAVIGLKPVDDARADELRNKNLNANDEQLANPVTTDEGSENQNEA